MHPTALPEASFIFGLGVEIAETEDRTVSKLFTKRELLRI